jgi:hypothetical protein
MNDEQNSHYPHIVSFWPPVPARKNIPRQSSDTLVVSQGSDLLTLDRFHHRVADVLHPANIFDPLTDIDANLKLQPCLAENWDHDARRALTFACAAASRFNAIRSTPPTSSIRSGARWIGLLARQVEIRTIENRRGGR